MLNISSVNVNRLNEKNKRNTILTHFANSADDICFLQEQILKTKLIKGCRNGMVQATQPARTVPVW